MADTTQLFKGGAAPVGSGAPTAPKTTITTSAPAGAGSILSLMKMVKTASTLSAEGREYIKKIEEAVKANGFECTMTRIAGANYEGYALTVLDKVFGFIMLETLRLTGDGMPSAAAINDFRNALAQQAKIDPEKLEQFILVSKQMYENVETMISFVVNYCNADQMTEFKHLSVASFKDTVLKVTTDQEHVMQYIRAVWPGDVADRHDVAFLIYGTLPIKGQVGADGKQAVETIPLVAVTGYTEFIYAKAGSMYAAELRHVPLFVITGVYSGLPSSRLTALGLAASATVFITKGQWLEPYSRYVKGAPDIGNLATDDQTGKLYSVQDVVGRNNILNNYLVTKVPRLALDVQLGRPLMPGLKDIFSNPAKLNAEIDSFTGGHGASSARGITQAADRRRYDGVCKITRNGVAEEVDTRTIDPLFLIGQGVNPGDCADLYNYKLDDDAMVDASKRAEIVKRFVPGAQMRYLTTRTILEPEWICNITKDMNTAIMVDVDSSFSETTYDISAIRGFDLDNIGAMPMFTSGFAPAGIFAASGGFGF